MEAVSKNWRREGWSKFDLLEGADDGRLGAGMKRFERVATVRTGDLLQGSCKSWNSPKEQAYTPPLITPLASDSRFDLGSRKNILWN